MNSAINEGTKEVLGKALGRISNGVYIATVTHGDEREGMLATWVAQAAFNPPMLTLAVNKERHILRSLKAGTRFTLNVLKKSNYSDIFKAFLKPAQPGEDRFTELKLADKPTGGPVFADALAYLDCSIKEQIEAGDHIVVLAEITSGELLNEDEPMLHTRKNGFQY